MINEPQRLQYLSAMGITSWVARYRLPNALATPACEWPLSEAPVAPAPAQRLHALLDELPVAPVPAPEMTEPSRPARRGKARAMLEGGAHELDADVDIPSTTAGEDTLREAADVTPTNQATEPQQALRFTMQVAALEGRWLVLLAQPAPPDSTSQRLLGNLLRAADIHVGEPPGFQAFQWPIMEALPVEAPLEESRDGLRAFIEGRRRSGWHPQRVLLFGDDPVLTEVLEVHGERSVLLDLPLWQGPTLAELGVDAKAKRKLLPQLGKWRDAWENAAADSAEDASAND